mgnify:CR=1 FL=1
MKPLNRIEIVFLILAMTVFSQEQFLKIYSDSNQFSIDKLIPHTAVKSQDSTGTCWVFSTLSFLESELLREGKEEIDLSEMFIVRHIYPEKALNYFRLHGRTTFGEGGLSHDVLAAIQRYGIVPEEIYSGKKNNSIIHHQFEMAAILKSMLDAILGLPPKHLTMEWKEALSAVLDSYLGQPPDQFRYKGRDYSPLSFAKHYLQLDLENYVELTSFLHHPFYQKFRLEIPDNWSCYQNYWNVTLDELEEVVDEAIQNGFSVVWDGDVGDKNYADENTNYAIVPMGEEGNSMENEKEITAEIRQEKFDNFETTDDHLLHLIGIAHNRNGKKFYLVKDSWYANTTYRGYIYLSRSYFRLKTVSIMLHKQGIMSSVRKKLNI